MKLPPVDFDRQLDDLKGNIHEEESLPEPYGDVCAPAHDARASQEAMKQAFRFRPGEVPRVQQHVVARTVPRPVRGELQGTMKVVQCDGAHAWRVVDGIPSQDRNEIECRERWRAEVGAVAVPHQFAGDLAPFKAEPGWRPPLRAQRGVHGVEPDLRPE
jgi:hypothetical protein